MARRPGVHGSRLWRQAILADLERIQRRFPTDYTAERIRHVMAGGEILVTDGRLHRGLLAVNRPDVADKFGHTGKARIFRLDSRNALTELGEVPAESAVTK